jgi:hypothetical protein
MENSKKKLRLDDISVESFVTAPQQNDSKGGTFAGGTTVVFTFCGFVSGWPAQSNCGPVYGCSYDVCPATAPVIAGCPGYSAYCPGPGDGGSGETCGGNYTCGGAHTCSPGYECNDSRGIC